MGDTDATGGVSTVQARHRFHPLRVLAVRRETDDAASLVFDVPADLTELFRYSAGQFVTLRVTIEGETHVRSYSMSSSPDVDPELQVTVKRVPGGLVSNWLNQNVSPGEVLEVIPPAGSFVLGDGDVIAFAAGSGITPVLSITKTALATTDRRVRLLYANRDRASVIFADELEALAAAHPDRFVLRHHLDDESGFVDGGTVTEFTGDWRAGEIYVCGPTPFMNVIDATLIWNGVPRDRVHVERFTPPTDLAPAGPVDDIKVVITLGGRTVEVEHHMNATILQSARSAGLRAPSSCETGSCATCMARVVEGSAVMRVNEALDEDEVADGWVLTCQATPATPVVKVVYE